MSGRRRVVLAAAVLLLGACGGSEADPDVAAPPTDDAEGRADVGAESEDGTAAAPLEREPVEVELVDAGEEPHTELRLSPEVGDQTRVQVASQQEAVGADPDPGPDGPPTMTLALEVDEVDEERIEAGWTIEEVDSDDEELVAYLMGVEGTLELDDRGRVHDMPSSFGTEAEIDPKSETFDEASMLLTVLFDAFGLLPVFPSEPVGTGAVWTLEEPSMLPAPHREIETITLDELDGVDYRLATEATYGFWQEWFDWQEQAAEEVEGVHPPGLLEVDGHGTGEVTGSLDEIVPGRASRVLEMTTVAELPEGEPHEATMRIEDRLEGN